MINWHNDFSNYYTQATGGLYAIIIKSELPLPLYTDARILLWKKVHSTF